MFQAEGIVCAETWHSRERGRNWVWLKPGLSQERRLEGGMVKPKWTFLRRLDLILWALGSLEEF